ncbi:MAG TPA: 30S ribosomal protein S6 [Candidatus Saccharimonadia bacterium]
MRPYELVVVLHPDLEIDVDAPIAKIERLVGGVNGTITKRDNWGKRRLAYPVKKQQYGIYVYFELELPAEAVREIETQLLIIEEVIRFLLVRKLILQRNPENQSKPRSTEELKPATAASKE